mgnify:CR=1 FL=1
MKRVERPFFPIIYVRGYAMTENEISETVATPYMGFNLGATKIRQDWEGKVIRHIFESPLVRLMKDYGYQDTYAEGAEKTGMIDPRSIIIYRYYEQADNDLGTGHVPSVLEAAKGLGELILQVRRQVCGSNSQALAAFKVYLVAHSMGGLVCRCFLQNSDAGSAEARGLVDKVFTYATPHNGIEMAGFNVPKFMGIWDMNNFNREHIAGYLQLAGKPERVDSLDGRFDPNRFFCLVGTNHKDYNVALGLSSKLAGEMSDGLVRIPNATVEGAPRAFVYRSHSGHYGIVNSEEGYQNLVRFLFGDVRVDGILEIDALPLPPSVRKAFDAGKVVRASYYFEATVAPRAATTYKLTERRKETFSAVLRKFDELLKPEKMDLENPRSPVLFSVFLDTKKITAGQWLVFSLDVAVSATDYVIDGFLWNDQRIEGEYLFRNTIVVRARLANGRWELKYNLTDDAWGENAGLPVEQDQKGMYVPCASDKGFNAKLRLQAREWE